MSLDSNQELELAKAVTRTIYFVELQFAGGTQRMSNANQTIEWGGYPWYGIGALGSIDAVQESDSIEPKALNFVLNLVQPEWLAISIGQVGDYRGLAAKLYFCPLAEDFTLVGTPELCWRGIMDTVTVGIEGETGSIILKCETSAYGLKRQPNLRVNAAQHKKIYPTDTGFDYLINLIANPQLWLSVRFQKTP